MLVDAKTSAVIDFKFGTGYRTDGVSSVEPHYEGSWEHEDGTIAKYRILRSGFKNSEPEKGSGPILFGPASALSR